MPRPSPRRAPAWPVVLLTDFGPASAYTGQIKCVIERLAPGTPVIDLAHDLPPQDIAAAALVLFGARAHLPQPCVVCAVVDPGVGSSRRILAAEFAQGIRVLAPDNGLLALWCETEAPRALHALANADLFQHPVSPVFHGRDIFAPVAARLACGLPLEETGAAIQKPAAPPPWTAPERTTRGWMGQVLCADRFGNLITSLRTEHVPSGCGCIMAGRRRIKLCTHYAEAPAGTVLALPGSFGFLELAVRNGSAAQTLGFKPGTPVLARVSDRRLTNRAGRV